MGALISAAFLMYYCERNKKFNDQRAEQNPEAVRLRTKQLVKKIIHYSIPITICVGMTYAGNIVDLYNTKVRLMAGGFSDTNATILYGYLVKYQQLLNVPIALISSLSAAILPALSAAAAVRNRKELHDKIAYSLRLCFLIALPCAVGLGVLSTPIYNMLKFGNGAFIMAYGSVVLVFLSVMQIQSTILQGIGKLYIATVFSITGIIFKITVNYFLIAIPKINILGAIIGSIVGFSIPIILNQRIINKTLKIRIRLYRHALKPFLASIFMGAMVFATYFVLNSIFGIISKNYLFKSLAVIISITAGAYYYLIGLIFTRGIKKQDLNIIPGKLKKFIPRYLIRKII
jgi:stage V sporulation protein B